MATTGFDIQIQAQVDQAVGQLNTVMGVLRNLDQLSASVQQNLDGLSAQNAGKSIKELVNPMKEFLAVVNTVERTTQKLNSLLDDQGQKLNGLLKTGQQQNANIRAARELELQRIDVYNVEARKLNDIKAAKQALLAIEREIAQQQLAGSVANTKLLENQRKVQSRLDALQAERGIEGGLQRIAAGGGAFLLAIQARLLANYATLNVLTGAFQSGVQFIIEFDKALRNLGAIAGLTNTQLGSIKTTIVELSRDTKFSAAELAEAATTLAQAGFSVRQIRESLAPIALFATATGTDLKSSVDLITTTLTVFKLSATETTRIVNGFTEAINGSKLGVDQLVLGFQYAANVAADSGLRVEELTAALGGLANAGIRSGSTLGTGFSQILVDLANPTDKLQDTLKRLGLSMLDVDVRTKGFVGVLETLQKAGFNAADALQGFEVRAARALIASMSQIDTLRQLEQASNLSNAAVEANAKQMESFANVLAKTTAAMQSLFNDAFEPTAVLFRDFLKAFTDVLNKMAEFENAVKAVGAVLSTLAIGVVIISVVRLTAGLAGLVFGAGALATGLGIANAGLAKLGIAMTATAGTTAFLSGALGFLANVARLVLGPVGLIVTALGVLAYTMTSSGNKTETLADKIEKSTTKYNDLKTAIDEGRNRLSSLDTTLERLVDRYSTLSDNQEELKTETIQAVARFNELGGKFNLVGETVDTLIEKVQKLREELGRDVKLALIDRIEQANVQIGNLTQNKEPLGEGLRKAAGRNSVLGAIAEQATAAEGPNTFAILKGLEKPLNDEIERLRGKVEEGKTATGAARAGFQQARRDLEQFTKFRLELSKYIANESSILRTENEQRRDLLQKAAFEKREDPAVQAFIEEFRKLEVEFSEKVAEIAEKRKTAGGISNEETVRIFRGYANRFKQLQDNAKAQGEEFVRALTVAGNEIEISAKRQSAATRQAVEIQKDVFEKQADLLEGELEELRKRVATLRAEAEGSFDQSRLRQIFEVELPALQHFIFEKTIQLADITTGRAREMFERGFVSAATDRNYNQMVRTATAEVQRGQQQNENDRVAGDRRFLRREGEILQAQLTVARRAREAALSAAGKKNLDVGELAALRDQVLRNFEDYKVGFIERIKKVAQAQGQDLNSPDFLAQLADAESQLDSERDSILSTIGSIADRSLRIGGAFTLTMDKMNAAIEKITLAFDEQLLKIEEASRTAEARSSILSVLSRAGLVASGSVALADYEAEQARGQEIISSTRAKIEADVNEVNEVIAAIESLKAANAAVAEAEREGLIAGGEAGIEQAKLRIEQNTLEIEKLQLDVQRRQQGISFQRNVLEKVEAEKSKGFFERLETQTSAWLLNQSGGAKSLEDFFVQKFPSILSEAAGAFETAFDRMTEAGGLTAKSLVDTFRNLGFELLGIIKKVALEAAVQSLFKSALGAAGGDSKTGGTGLGTIFSSIGSFFGFGAATGGMVPNMKLRGYAAGGSVDTVPAMLQPGEFIMSKKAVDYFGVDAMATMNNLKIPNISNENGQQGGGGVVNVWVVTPDQMPNGLGPNDVVATVADNISRGGTIKTLIKQVATAR